MGFIKLDRKTLEWEWFTDITTCHLWIYILLNANHEKKMWHGIEVDEGSFITSEQKMSNETGLSRQQIRSSLAKLISTNEITKKSTNKYTTISVIKWAIYQYSKEKSNQQPNQQATHQITTTKKYKEYKEIKNKYIERKSNEFIAALTGYEEMRKKIKKPLTDRAEVQMLNKLDGLSQDEQEQIQILDQATQYCWLSVYALKEKDKVDKLPVYDTSGNKPISQEEEQELLKLMKG